MTAIEVDRFLPYPPDAVWRVLTDPASLGRWLMPNDFQPVVGHRFTFTTEPQPGFDGVIRCEVLALEQEQLMRISWVSSGLDTTVTWTLSAEGRGTRLLLVHDGFDGADPAQERVRRLLGGGWSTHLQRRLLAELAAGVT
jgi:uncharacterized protein YndB with AHSA1/START domain